MPDTRHTPGLHLHTSNRQESLAMALAEITRTPLSSPFRAETIVVQSQGMARWLKQRLADHHGICAQVRFPFPNEMASELFLVAFPELPAKPPFDREVMLWLVMKHLPGLLDEAGFEDPRNYLTDRGDLRKRHQLARKVAYLFDQYFIFRPERIRAWDRGEDKGWQAQLWRRIRPEIPHRHPAELQEHFARLMREPDLNTSSLPERLCVFGVSALPPFHLNVFTALGAHLPVHLFVVQPSREYWGDITSAREEERLLKRHGHGATAAAKLHLERGNRLLASLGPLGRDFLKLIYESGDWQEFDDFAEPEGDALLARIQSDILNLRDRGREEPPDTERLPVPGPASRGSGASRGTASRRNNRADTNQMFLPFPAEAAEAKTPPAAKSAREVLAPDDDSIQVHSCHSPLREMEVLHDHLLDWFSHDPELAPHDIVVMMPDIETYASFIDAVFGSPEDESRRIPFRIADRGERQVSQIIRTFLALLHFPQTRFGAATVLALLENRGVRERFALSEADLELARHWIEETHIRWGADPEHRTRLELPNLPGNTWRDGLDRLLLGYAMAGHGRAMFEGIAPYDDLEGNSALVLGRLVAFIERLTDTAMDLGRSRPLREWAERLQRVLDDFFQNDEDSERDLQTIRSALRNLRQQHALSQFDDPVDIAVVLEQLTPELEQDRHGAGFLGGGVTFCALKPMRSIPFKVICLVGMNDSRFPRPNVRLSFDLMAEVPRLGDRSTRNDDRYLFLETILSARQRLYLSYVGQSVRDNSSVPPSVVVSELLDYVEQGFRLGEESAGARYAIPVTQETPAPRKGAESKEGALRDRLVTRHRLQAFHEEYFQPEGRLFSYSLENCRASQATRRAGPRYTPLLKMPLGEPEPELRQVTIDDLAAFLCNPAAFLLQRRLLIRLRHTEGALEEREPFDLDAREGYGLKQQLLDDRLAGLETRRALAQVAASGVLPLGQVGEAHSHSLAADLEAFWQRLSPFSPHQASPVADVDLALGDFRLSGRVMPHGAGGVLSYRVASIKPQDILRLWIRHLTACAIGNGGGSVLVGTDAVHRYGPCQDATGILDRLLQLYWEGLRQPLRFFPRSSLAFARAVDKRGFGSESIAKALDEALKQWAGNPYSNPFPERDDLSFNLCFGEETPFDAEFEQLARQVFDPVLQHETVEEES